MKKQDMKKQDIKKQEDEIKLSNEESSSGEEVSQQEEEEEEEEESGNSSSEAELSSDSEEESDSENIKGLQEQTPKEHIIIKPSKQVNKSNAKQDKRGIIYIGRIPQRFQEAEMKKYFEQFGDITRLKLSRNKKTGQPKHYGFIEFNNQEVAKIACDAMNNYLVFGHLLKCYVIEDPKKGDLIFSDKKFKIIPWKSISRHRNDKPKTQAKWDKLQQKYEGSQVKKSSDLKKKGIDISYLG